MGFIKTLQNKPEKEKILSEIINSYILKDIQLYNYSANSLQIKKILTLLADRTGCLLDINNLALNAGLGRAELDAVLARLGDAWAGSPVILDRVDSIAVRLESV